MYGRYDIHFSRYEVIISVAFGVMMMKQLTRQRLLTTLNNYMAQGDERRSLQSAPKASLLRPLAKLLLAKKIVVLRRVPHSKMLKGRMLKLHCKSFSTALSFCTVDTNVQCTCDFDSYYILM